MRNQITRDEALQELARRQSQGQGAQSSFSPQQAQQELKRRRHPFMQAVKGQFQPGGAAYNVLGGLDIGLANALNIAPEALNYLSRKMGGPSDLYSGAIIPTPKDVQPGIGKTIGEIGSYFVPEVGAEKAIAGGLRALPEISQFLSKLPARLRTPAVAQAAKSALSGAAAGGAVSPEGERGTGALIGGTAGAVAPSIPALTKGFRTIGDPEVASRFTKGFAEAPPFEKDEEVQKEMLNKLAQNFVDSRNKSAPLYKKVFNSEKLKPMTASSLKNYSEALKDMPQGDVGKLKSVKRLGTAPEEEVEEQVMEKGVPIVGEKKTLRMPQKIKPEDVHFYQSKLGRILNRMDRRGDYEGYESILNAKEALQKDLKTHLNKYDLNKDYEAAKSGFKKDTAPFLTKAKGEGTPPMRNIYNALNKTRDNHVVSFDVNDPLKEGERYADYLKPMIERPKDTDLSRLHRLTKFLNGDRDAAIKYTKHHLFKDTYNENTGEINPTTFINKYDKLSEVQRDSLFNNDQRREISALRRSKDILKGVPTTRTEKMFRQLSNIGMGVASGARFHSPEAALAGYALLPTLRAASKQISKTFLPETQKGLEEYLLGAKRPVGKFGKFAPKLGGATAVSLYPGTKKRGKNGSR